MPEPWEEALEQIRAEYARSQEHRPWRNFIEVLEDVYAYVDEVVERARKERAMNQEEHDRQLLLAFLDWLERQGDTICYLLDPQDKHSYVPSSRTGEKRVSDFLFSRSTE